jgi:hypothetical protein
MRIIIASAMVIAAAVHSPHPSWAQQPISQAFSLMPSEVQEERYNSDGTCKPPYITCATWCAESRNNACMSGPANFCEKQPLGGQTCVRETMYHEGAPQN